MWIGQLFCEAVNWMLKHAVKQERPVGAKFLADCTLQHNDRFRSEAIGHGYGFPSSHSQYMGYFSSFLMMHLYFKHRFTSTGSRMFDQLFRLLVYFGLASWASLVCYSRWARNNIDSFLNAQLHIGII